MGFDFSKKKKEKIEVDSGNSIVFTVVGMNPASSYLAYELSQIASLSKKRTDIIFIDDKEVEEEDIKYGKFVKSDLGLNRACVTAKRCSSSFNIDIETLDKSRITKDDILNLYKGRIGYLPVIICTSPTNTMLEAVKGALDKLSDAVVIVTNEYDLFGELNFHYKKDSVFMTKNDLDSYMAYFTKITNKTCPLEMSKNIFLYIDDILCERPIATEKVVFDIRKKISSSKYIGDQDISLDKRDEFGLIVPTNENILCIVIGLGGTGGSIAYEVAHLASTSNKNIVSVFIDGDIIENKNLNRQRFIVEDLNRYKAYVTAKRCRKAYNVDIIDKNQYIESENDIYDIIKSFKGFTPIIIGCSDSLKLRHLVCETIKNAYRVSGIEDIIYIDAGNGEDYGQVNFTYMRKDKYVTPDYFQTSPQSLEDVFTAKLVTQMSCDELMNSAPQTKGANMASAITAFSYFENVVTGSKITSYMSYFNNVNRRIESKSIKLLEGFKF